MSDYNKKFYTEAGFISELGKQAFRELLDKNIESLLKEASNENEARLIGSLIQQRVGNLVSNCCSQLRSNEKKT